MNILNIIAQLRDVFVLILSIGISLILMNSSHHPAAEVFRHGLRQVISVISTPLMFIPRSVQIWSENADLRQQVIELENERNQWRDAMLENIRLRKMLEFEQRADFSYLAAEVIARDPMVNLGSLLLNKGERDGVRVGQAVVTADGLAGVIHEVQATTSIVQIATDGSFAASVRIERNRVDGILRYKGRGTLIMDDVVNNIEIRKGDRVLTSGLGGVIPSGIPVGVVSDTRKVKGGIFQIIEVEPYVAFSRLEEVFVLRL